MNQTQMRTAVAEFKNEVETNDAFGALRVGDHSEEYGYVVVEYDDRHRSQQQITKLQKDVKGPVPFHDDMVVDFADIENSRVRFLTEGDL